MPGNIFGLQAAPHDDGTIGLSFNVLQLIVISVAIGIAVLKVGEAAEPFLRLTRSALAIVQKVLWWVILLAPLGTVGLIGNAVASYGWESLGSLGVFAGAVYAGLALVLFVVYPVLLRLHGLSPLRFFAGAWPAIQLAFVSRSSIGTLPVTERVTEQNLGVPRSYASFAVPFGATTKMDGCAAIYPALAAIFVAQFFHVRPVDHRLPAHRPGLGHRLGGHRRRHRRGGHADADPVHAGPAAGRRRPAAGDRPDPRHGPHRGERRRPGAGADDRRQARGHPRRRALPTRRPPSSRWRAVEQTDGVDDDLREPVTV